MICICTIAKNEEDYLQEWIEYHLKIGFDFIVLYDNNDNNKQEEICKKYQQVLCVKFKEKQYAAYNHFLKHFGEDFDYIAFIDIDEFIVFNPDQPIQNIKDFINKTNREYYHFSWMVMDDNDLVYKDDRPVMERFTRPLKKFDYGNFNFPVNFHVKSLIKYNKNLKSTHSHYFNCGYKCYNCDNEEVDGNSPVMYPNHNVCYIKHFLTKSAEEYRNNKMSRLRVDLNIEYYTMSLFFKYNTFTEEIYKVLKETKSS